MSDSDQNQKDKSKDLKRKAPMASTSGPRPDNELPNLPEPQCLKDLIDNGKCTKPFGKQFTSSDKNQNKLALAKRFVKNECLPMLTEQEDVKKGVAVTVYGPDGRGYEMSFVFWGRADKYVLNKGWKEFVTAHDLKPLEHFVTVWMFRHKTTDALCFAITWRNVTKEEKVVPRYKTCRMNASNAARF